MKLNRILGICCAVAFALLLAAAWPRLAGSASAQPLAATHYVASTGCGAASPCYATIQEAVDAAQPGDEIRVAAGTYMGVNNQGGLSQALYIDKSVTIRGGFLTSNWDTPNPEANITELNAMTLGRGVYISSTQITVTLEGLHISYGDSTGLGGHQPSMFENYDAGGGVYVNESNLIIKQCVLGNNFAPSNGSGGGLYQRHGSLNMTSTTFEENEAGGGAGVYLFEAETQITANNQFLSNHGGAISAQKGSLTLRQSWLENNDDGTALYTFKTEMVVESNVISNTQGGSGFYVNGNGRIAYNLIHGSSSSGLSIGDGNLNIIGNEIRYNRGKGYDDDPGVKIDPVWGGEVLLQNNHIHHNTNTYSACKGAGLYIDTGPDGMVTVMGNLIEYNFAGEDAAINSHGYGGGMFLIGDNILLDSNIIRYNTAFGFTHVGNQYWGGYGGGVYINDSPTLQNNIIAHNYVTGGDTTHFHAPGIYVNGGSPELIHNTLAENTGGDGVGLYVIEDSNSGERSQVQMHNTIVVSHVVGIYAHGEEVNNVVVADGILWSGNISDTWGAGTFFVTHAEPGDPAFVDPAAGDYHIRAESAAIDKGVETAVSWDIDDEPRFGTPDLGADEYILPGTYQRIYLPVVAKK
ncbi:MAG TPA: right-handed parallel beta-helix repeat-containing protein [Anaerolineales bacterium]|nr:right-handed parallel beta-helix repeat-containing protein [Anaerolineales bacterium]